VAEQLEARLDDAGDAALKASQAANFDNLNKVVADTPFDRHMRFFNFGYRPLGEDQPVGPTLGRGFPNQDSAQLLFQVVGDTDLSGARVVEVGCGRGGNLWLLRRHYRTRSVTGVDIAFRSMAFAKGSIPDDDAQFTVGDAEHVPLAAGSADAVLSVETSCTYPDIELFFREVARLLRPHGHFLYTDLIHVDLIDPFVEVLASLGLELDHRRDITANVAASRDARAARQKLAYGRTPEGDETTMSEFVGVDGSQLYDALTDGQHQYTILRFHKAAEVAPTEARVLGTEARVLVRQQAQLAVDLLTIPSSQ